MIYLCCFGECSLSDLGRQQVKALGERVKAEKLDEVVELIVVSPLTRAIKTALGAFDPKKIPFYVTDLAREGQENACDLGRPRSVLQELYPDFQFGDFEEIWWATGPNVPGGHAAVNKDNYQQIFRDYRYEEPHG
jgi:broad specificity phosphatase PhoE